jgi:hypothetical protein
VTRDRLVRGAGRVDDAHLRIVGQPDGRIAGIVDRQEDTEVGLARWRGQLLALEVLLVIGLRRI